MRRSIYSFYSWYSGYSNVRKFVWGFTGYFTLFFNFLYGFKRVSFFSWILFKGFYFRIIYNKKNEHSYIYYNYIKNYIDCNLFYSAFFYYFFLNNKGLKSLVHISEERGIIGSMRVLLILSVFFGCFFRVNFFPVNIILLSSALKNMIFAFMMVLFVINIIFYTKSSSIVFPLTSGFVYYLGSIWFLPWISRVLLTPSIYLGGKLMKLLDQGWLEYLGGQGSNSYLSSFGARVDFLTQINVKRYLFIFLLLIIILLVIL